MSGIKGNQYAWLMETPELAKEIDKRFNSWLLHPDNERNRVLFKRSYAAFYGHQFGQYGRTGRAGDQGQFSTTVINHARSVIKNVMSLTLQNRLAFQCIGMNTDVKTRNNAAVGEALLEQFFYEKRYEQIARYAFELGLMSGTAYIYTGWKTGVNPVGTDPETGELVYAGEPDVYSFSVLDAFCEPYKDNFNDQNWFIFRRLENRYDLMNKYPEVAEEIANVPTPKEIYGDYEPFYAKDESLVWVYYGFHKPTPALPAGRFIKCLADEVVISDDVNPYEKIPVVCYRPEMRFGSAFGHTPFFDLMPIQEEINILDSATLTIAENFAMPNIVASDTFNAEVSDLPGGLKLIQGRPDPDAPGGGFPQPMVMPKPDESFFSLRQQRVNDIGLIAGINNTVRGDVSANLSGTAFALINASAKQFNSIVEAGYIAMVEDFARHLIDTCRFFMRTQELVQIVGAEGSFLVRTFEASDLRDIAKVKVDLGNAVSRTIAGKVEMANQLLAQQMITKAEYINILKTGQLSQYIDPISAEQSYVKLENEYLLRGQRPVISPLDNHIEHIRSHHALLSNPDVRENGDILALVLEHIQEHVDVFTGLAIDSPMMLDIALGNPPRLPTPGPDAMVGGGGAAPEGQPQPPQVGNAPEEGKQTADAAIEGGVPAVAAAGERRANKVAEGAEQEVAEKNISA
jgi:hypothetical protein